MPRKSKDRRDNRRKKKRLRKNLLNRGRSKSDVKTQKDRERKIDRPFYIHACPSLPAYPTHTHGLTDVGLPEFIMDPLAFGPYGNARTINAAYDFFAKPDNKGAFEAFMNGETVRLTPVDLYEENASESDLIYCFREVSSDFQAVKEAYITERSIIDVSRMRFIQIYIDGDDFALTNEYYKGGVTG